MPHTDSGTPVWRGGLIVPVPEAEGIVRTWRDKIAPTLPPGVPAHVTLLFPFPTLAELDPAGLAKLQSFFAETPAMTATFTSVGRFPGFVYLAPEPRDWFINCTTMLSARFELPPYGGLHGEIVPHLTVAQHPDPSVLDEVARELALELPITTQVREVWLMEELAEGHWSHSAPFPLGPPA